MVISRVAATATINVRVIFLLLLGWDDFIIVAHHLAHLGGAPNKVVTRIVEWAMWAPTFSADKVAERADLVAEKPIKFRADTLAWRLRLTMEERTRLKITSIGAFDVPKEDRPEWLRKQPPTQGTPSQRHQAAQGVSGSDQGPGAMGGVGHVEGHLVSPGQARRKTEMGSIHGPETGSGRPGRKKDNGMPHPVSPISKAGGSEALAKPFQGENLTKGTPSAHHPAARERSQPKATDPKKKEKLYQAVSTAPIMAISADSAPRLRPYCAT